MLRGKYDPADQGVVGGLPSVLGRRLGVTAGEIRGIVFSEERAERNDPSGGKHSFVAFNPFGVFVRVKV